MGRRANIHKIQLRLSQEKSLHIRIEANLRKQGPASVPAFRQRIGHCHDPKLRAILPSRQVGQFGHLAKPYDGSL